MRDPDLAGPGLGDGLAQLVPVGMVGDHQRQLDAGLAGALLDAHPARGDGQHRIGQPPAPAILDGGGRRDDDLAGEFGLAGTERVPEFAQRNAAFDIEFAEPDHRAVQVDRRVVAGVAQERDHPLRLAQRVAADDVGTIGKCGSGAEQPADLVERIGVLEHGQPEGGLGDQQVALGQLERLCGAIG